MKKTVKNTLCLLLAFLLAIPFVSINAFAAGEVYTVDGKPTVFLAENESVTIGEETYNTYGTLKEAFAALGTSGGVIVVCGSFTDPTTSGDQTFSDVSGRSHVLIKGDTPDAVLSFNHTLTLKGGALTFENVKLNCLGTKYVKGGPETIFGEGFTTGGNIFYNLIEGSYSGRTEFNSAAVFKQLNLSGGYSSIGSASSKTPALAEIVINNINLQGIPVNAGFNNVDAYMYGNVNVIINGGTFSNKSVVMNKMAEPAKGAVTVIFNNGMADGFSVTDAANYVVKSAAGGNVSIKTQAAFGGAPELLFTPEEGLSPTVNGTAILANSDGEYILTPSVSSSKQTFEVAWIDAGASDTPVFYSINGVKTGFVKTGGGADNYDGVDVVAFDSFLNACKANTNKEAITLVVIGEISDNLSIPNNYPSHLTIVGADNNALWTFDRGIHPWGKTTIKNIKIASAGNNFCCDGKEVVIGEGVTGTFSGQVFGGGDSSPHGGKLTLEGGTYTGDVYAGSSAPTTTAGAGHYLTINGGDFTGTLIDGGSTVSTAVPGSVVVALNGGEYADGAEIKLSNVTSAGGIKAVIIGNGLDDEYSFAVSEDYDYVIKSGVGGNVSFDGEAFVLTPESGYAALVDGKLSTTGKIETGAPGTYNVSWISASGTPAAYMIDGVKTAFVKAGGGIAELDDGGNAKYAYSDIREAVVAAIGGKVKVIGEYDGNLRDYWGGSGTTTITGYDENAVWTLGQFYNWTPIVIENLTIAPKNGADVALNADARTFKIGKGVTMTQNCFILNGGSGSTNRNIDVTVESGKFKSVCAGNTADIGNASANTYTVRFAANGGDFSEADFNLGNGSASVTTLYGNLYAELNGGVFADGQVIRFANINVTGNSVLVITNDLDTTYNLGIPAGLDYVVKVRDGGTAETTSLGGEVAAPTFVFTPDDGAKAPAVNGSLLSLDANGKYTYTPALSDTQSVLEITWEIDNRAKAYFVDGVLTSFVNEEEEVTIDDETYYTFPTLTEAVAALGKAEGRVVVAGSITNSGGDKAAFVDTVGRAAVTVTGLTGAEVVTLDGTFGFKGETVLDNFTLSIPKSVYAKYINNFSSITFGENFKVDENGGAAYFAMANYIQNIDRDLKATVNGGTFDAFNVSGAGVALPAGKSVTAVINGGKINKLNLGMAESGNLGADVNVEINADVISNKTLEFKSDKTTLVGDPTVTVIFNNGVFGYSFDENASLIVDYIVRSESGGHTSVYSAGTSEKAPTFILTPNEGYAPKIGGVFVEKTGGEYLYTPEFTSEKTEFNVEWVDETALAPAVYDIDGKRCAFVKAGGGVVYFGGEARFAYVDLNTAVAALGSEGGYAYLSGDCTYVNGDNTENFIDVAGRERLCIRGVEGTSPRLVYTRSLVLNGNIDLDGFTFHRTGTTNDVGLVHRGFSVKMGENFKTSSDKTDSMQIYAANYESVTFGKAVLDISGGTISSLFAGGTTYGGGNVNGDVDVIIRGGGIGKIFGGSHGGNTTDSITNGNISISILGGKVSTIYTGVNNKTGINGNVVVRISGGDLSSANLNHGSAVSAATNYINGNSVFVITGGKLNGAALNNSSSNGVSGKSVYIVSDAVSGYTRNSADNETFIVYDSADGTVEPYFEADGTLSGYEIICGDDGKDIIIDGVKVEKTDDNIYTVPNGNHTVIFSTLHEITFDANGALGTVPAAMKAYDGTVITLPTSDGMSKENFKFVGWSTDSKAESGFAEYTVPDDNITLYAVWNEIKPELCEKSNIENSDAAAVVITSIPDSEYDTNGSVVSAKSYTASDAIVINGAETVYAYSLEAFDDLGNEVSDFPNGLNIRIPKSVLPETSIGEVLRLYRVNRDTGDVEIIGISSEDSDFIYYTEFAAGDYAVMLAYAKSASHIFEGTYDAASGKYTVNVYFTGAVASYGTFGVKYDAEKLENPVMSFDSAVVTYTDASKPEASGGFGSAYNQNGIFQSTWKAANNMCINAESEKIKVATITFSVTDKFAENPISILLSEASFDETGLELSEGTLETVYGGGNYLYAPFIPSSEVYCQPINSVFAEEGADKSAVTGSYLLARDAADSFYDDETIGYNSEAKLVIYSGGVSVLEISESTMTASASIGGNAVITFECRLSVGDYTAKLMKNGYVSHTQEFSVSGTDIELDTVTLVGGDIKESYEDFCGNGKVDIDDFIRLIRGFADNAGTRLGKVVDIDEDGVPTIEDLEVIKTNYGAKSE